MGTRSRMCHGGWEVWVHGGGAAIVCISELKIVRSVASYCVLWKLYVHIYTYPIHIQCAMLYKNTDFVVTVMGSLIYSSCYCILLLY